MGATQEGGAVMLPKTVTNDWPSNSKFPSSRKKFQKLDWQMLGESENLWGCLSFKTPNEHSALNFFMVMKKELLGLWNNDPSLCVMDHFEPSVLVLRFYEATEENIPSRRVIRVIFMIPFSSCCTEMYI